MLKRHFSIFLVNILLLLFCACGARAFEKRIVDIPMRDGVKLKADVYLPDGDGPFPVVLNRTPYNRKGVSGDGEKFAARSIAFVAVDVRGRFESEGEFVPFADEGSDGADTLKWMLAQPWCNGKVAGHGGSYVGYTQWALTSEPNPGLVTIVPLFTTANIYEVPYRGGDFNLATALGWASTMYDKNKIDSAAYLLARNAMRFLPLVKGDNRTGHQIDFYDDWLRHPEMDVFWERMNHGKNFRQKNVPALMVAGWFDLFLGPQLDDFVRMTTEGPPETAGKSHIIIGPWDHSGGLISSLLIELPDDAKKFDVLRPIGDAWYDYWLLGGDHPAPDLPPVRLFVMGSNLWMDFETWPPPGMEPTPWYLHSAGSAASPEDGASLSETPPLDEPPDTYDYNPKKPTPSRGGTILGTDMGPYDYSSTERERADILSYTSEPLDDELTIIGPVTMKLYASTTACGTDYVARLLDVTPDGVAIPLVEGIVRMQTVDEKPPSLGDEGEYEIDLWATAWTFLPGHSVRVDIASSAFPHWDRNLNTCDKPFAVSKKTVTSTQAVYHDAEHPSHIVLPIFSGR